MNNEIVDKANVIIKPVVEKVGYEVVDIDYSKSYGEYNLTVYIYKKGGITFEDCEKVNDALDSVLEENDITNGMAYNLNISSPGLDRPIVSLDDYRRNLDEEIEIIFDKPLGKKKKAVGILIAYDDIGITLKNKEKVTVYEKSNCKVVRPYIKF